MFENRTGDARRRERSQAQVELRKQRRDELLNKKRSTTLASSTTSGPIPNMDTMRTRTLSDNTEEILSGVYEFRTLLSVEMQPPIQAVIDSGLVPRFVELLSPSCLAYKAAPGDLATNIRLEAAWVLTNIASGTTVQTQVVVDAGAVPLLVSMLEERNEELVDQAIWALGNIAGDSEKTRDEVINSGAGKTIVTLISTLKGKDEYLRLLRNATWLLSNLNRGRNPPPSREHMALSVSGIEQLLLINDSDIINDSFWALSYICDADEYSTDLVLNTFALDRAWVLLKSLVEYLQGKPGCNEMEGRLCLHAISPIIRMIGNIVTGSDLQTNKIIEKGFLPLLKEVLLDYKESNKTARIKKEICWTISNITAGTQEQVQAVMDAGFIPLLIDALVREELFVRTEACWALTNALSYTENNQNHLQVLINAGFLEALKDFLEAVTNVPEMQIQVLDGLRRALASGRVWGRINGSGNEVAARMIDCGLTGVIEGLAGSGGEQIRERADSILEEYFETYDEEL
ncbi:Importin subunit alpha-6 [Astathelohania contejeani]|uniref:Importin subunit alpha n=1 Tax=Astathelohania contejeani TaxID=164912 RepID=A0ABQ7I0B9_9MICR|nr:Importin subunit alpha-6 [Thelohania contejeani]